MLKEVTNWEWVERSVSSRDELLARAAAEADRAMRAVDRGAPRSVAKTQRKIAQSRHVLARNLRDDASRAPLIPSTTTQARIIQSPTIDYHTYPALNNDERKDLLEQSRSRPACAGSVTIRGQQQMLWLFKSAAFLADADLTGEDVFALVTEKENRRRLKLEKAHALMAMTEQLDERAKRQPIPQDIKMLVWQRDSGRCVQCGSQQELEYDHIIPLAMGGSNTERNLQLLCAACNRRKGATLG